MVHLRRYTRKKYIMCTRLLKMAIHIIHSSYASVHRISINLLRVSHRHLIMECVWCPNLRSSPSVEVRFTMDLSITNLDTIIPPSTPRSITASSPQCPLIMATPQIHTFIHLRDTIITHIWRRISQLGRLGPILELWWGIHLLDTRIQTLPGSIQPHLRTTNLRPTMILDTRARFKHISTQKRASSSIICSNRIGVTKTVAAVLNKVKISDMDRALTPALRRIKLKINKKMSQKM